MTLTRVSTPCSVFTRTLSLAMRLAAMDSLKKKRSRLVNNTGRRKDYLQERNYRGKTLWHECDKNGDRKSDTTSRLAFIRGGDTDNEEDYGEDDGDC